MKISLIMGTLNRKELMLRAVESVLSQAHQDFEIIIVDQSDDVYNEIELLDQRIKYIHICDRGLSLARNIGIKNATGDIVGLMDDDAVYDDDALEIVNDIFENDKETCLVSGIIVDPKYRNDYVKEARQEKIRWNNFMKTCMSAAMFVNINFFNQYQFDEELGVGCYLGSAEESDIVARILELRMKAVYCTEVVIYHDRIDGKKDIEIEKHKSYCRGFGAFFAKHIYRYSNKILRWIYIKAMLRTFGGLCLSMIRGNSFLKNLYKTTLNSRKEGFRIYKQYELEGKR